MANINLKILCSKLSRIRINNVPVRNHTSHMTPRYRPPYWYTKKERVLTNEHLTQDNKEFLNEVMKDKLNLQENRTSPLALETITSAQWTPASRRVGVIARKIGTYPLWSKDGKKHHTTLLQVVDNHIIKYIPPEDSKPMIKTYKGYREHPRYGTMLVGSETIDPSQVTKAYCGLFNAVGMLPKKYLCRFMVTPDAVLPTGTPLFATHFRVGDCIDIRAKTMDRGFQGVMKRWGFKGMPASHGVTKTHRRPGNIGGGGEKARVWPGTKMPGHMGNRWRITRGVRILRINTKHNVIWTLGVAIPGETGAMCYLYDTILPLKKLKSSPPFPTHLSTDNLPLEYIEESIHDFNDLSISFEES